MSSPSRSLERFVGCLYPSPRSTRTELIVVLTWSGFIGIVMAIGLVIDHGWIGRLGALIVLGGLIVPLWVRALRLLRPDRR